MTRGQVVDTEAAREFLSIALDKVGRDRLTAMGDLLRLKAERFGRLLAPDRLPALGREEWRNLLGAVFSVRRSADGLLERMGVEGLKAAVGDLLYGPGPVEARFRRFCETLESGPFGEVLPSSRSFDLAGELLHFSDPSRYWLWTRWVWEPRSGTGALRLVTLEEFSLHAPDPGQTYLRVGEGTAFVAETGEAAGFTRLAPAPFGVDLFLCCVYGVYFFTSLRVHASRELTQLLPDLEELLRRLLGIHRLKVEGGNGR